MLATLVLALFVYTGVCAVIAGAAMLIAHFIMQARAASANRADGGATAARSQAKPLSFYAAAFTLGAGLVVALSPAMVMSLTA